MKVELTADKPQRVDITCLFSSFLQMNWAGLVGSGCDTCTMKSVLNGDHLSSAKMTLLI